MKSTISILRLSLVAAALLSCAAWAARSVHVEALFQDRAVIAVDGQRHVLSVGKPGPEGILLLSANSREALLEVDGVRATYRLGNKVSSSFAPPDELLERIWPDAMGMYATVGSINGLPVEFLVDTGATYIALNGNQARRLGIEYRLKGRPATVTTASGRAQAFYVKLDRVKVGELQLRNVDAAVLEGEHPARPLLGMSFLGRLQMENRGGALVLKQRK